MIGINSLPPLNRSPGFTVCAISPADDHAILAGAVALAWTAFDAVARPSRDRFVNASDNRSAALDVVS